MSTREVAVEVEGVERGVESGLAEEALPRFVHGRFERRAKNGRDVESVLPALERLDREEPAGHPVGVGAELGFFGRRVALGDDDDIHAFEGIAGFLNFVEDIVSGRRSADDVIIPGIEFGGKERLENIVPIPDLHRENERLLRMGDADRPLENAPDAFGGRSRGFVFAEQAVESP